MSQAFASRTAQAIYTNTLSASYAVSASFAANGGGGGGTTLSTGSLVPITASQAISASWAPGGGTDVLMIQVFS